MSNSDLTQIERMKQVKIDGAHIAQCVFADIYNVSYQTV